MDALLAALDDSPDALLRVRTLLQQDGTLANGLDSSGTSALMHASAAGLAECCEALLACSADPRLRRASDGATALTLAAASCKPASICALLQHDTLIDEADGGGRTALHHAVTAGSGSTAKYLLGRWGADDAVVDLQGDSPLHLCTSPKLLLLLAYGPPSTATGGRPLGRLGTRRNAMGRTPVEAWEAAGRTDLVQAARTAGSWLHQPHPQELSAAVSFLTASPSRVPPRAAPIAAWPRRLLPVHLGIVLLPLAILALGCFFPLLGPRVWCGFWLWVSLGGILCLCAVPPQDWVTFFKLPSSLPLAALLLVAPVVQIILTNHAFLLLPLLTSHPLLATALLCAEAVVVRSYSKLLRVDAGFVPGGSAEAARSYWASFERPAAPCGGGGCGGPAGDGCGAKGEFDRGSMTPRRVPSMALTSEGAHAELDFDLRSETLSPPRARFSPMGGGLILGMDHDCPWVGGPVGHGNHVHFLSLLLAGDVALLLHVACVCSAQPLGIADPHWHRPLSLLAGQFRLWHQGGLDYAIGRLLLLSEAIALVLLLLISMLIYAQLGLIFSNVLTVEEMRWRRQHPGQAPPARGQPGWEEYAPYDLGSRWRCLLGFVRSARGCGGSTVGVGLRQGDKAV